MGFGQPKDCNILFTGSAQRSRAATSLKQSIELRFSAIGCVLQSEKQ
jgi:hypothetical protein